LFKTIAIILAAGQGKRMRTKVNKQYLYMLDKPVLAHTLQVFENHPCIDGVIVVAKADEIDFCFKEVVIPYKLTKVIKVVSGGKERQDSVYQGLQELPNECTLVVVHDGARPLVTHGIISKAINMAQDTGACIAAVPVKDTITRVNNKEIVLDTLPRDELWSAQTPQIFKKELLMEAYIKAKNDGVYGTDDAFLVERLGVEVRVVLGSYENIKITTPEDMEIGCSTLRRRQRCE